MNKTRTISVSPARKGELPDVWRKIKAMASNPIGSPYDRYSPEGIRAEREELKEMMRRFWSERKPIFARGHTWSECCAYAGLELGEGWDHYKKTREYYPSERLMHVFVLLSEPEFDCRCSELLKEAYRQIHWDDHGWHTSLSGAGLGKAGLVRILSPEALTDLVQSINGADLAALLLASVESEQHRPWNEKEGLVENLVEAFAGIHSSTRKLCEHLASHPRFASNIIKGLRKVKTERADLVAKQLTHFLECTCGSIQEVLESVRGG